MPTYVATLPVESYPVLIKFDGEDETHARRIATSAGAILNGTTHHEPIEPLYVDGPEARRLLGGVGKSTLYKMLALGRLERDPTTTKLCVSLASIRKHAERARRADAELISPTRTEYPR